MIKTTFQQNSLFHKTLLATALMASTSVVMAMNAGSAHAVPGGMNPLNRDGKLSKVPTIQLCVDYYKLSSETDKQDYIKELDLRSQLSVKDHNLLGQNTVENGMTMCGMYMNIGTPMSQKTKQLRPMVFKTVHVYKDVYTVTQSGMIVNVYQRKEGELPPKLVHEKPAVAPSPTLK